MAGRVLGGLPGYTVDALCDAFAESGGEQDGDQAWYVGAGQFAALVVAGAAVVAGLAGPEVTGDPLAQRGAERPGPGGDAHRAVDDLGQVRAVGASFLEKDQCAEAVCDEVLDDGGLVAGGLVGDAELLGGLPAGQFLDEPQLVHLLLPFGEGGDHRVHQAGGVCTPDRATRAGLLIVGQVINAPVLGQDRPGDTSGIGAPLVLLLAAFGDLDQPATQLVGPRWPIPLG